MSSSDAEEISDEDLASSISDDGRLSSEASDSSEDGMVEAGIPPSINDPSDDGDLDEEPFSVDDFDADMSIEAEAEPSIARTQEAIASPIKEEKINPVNEPSVNLEQSVDNLPDGQVAEFRKTLSALSRQLEIDRLTFLYQRLHSDGNELPPLDRIASDIKGESALHPLGDQDLYSQRPLARLQGWISGLSFGVGRRAKKFSR